MEFAFTEEQTELGRTLRRWLADRSPISEVRRLMEDPVGYDPAVWAEMATELGLQGLAIPECFGGSGFGWAELTVVFEEMGRSLLCAPFFATVALAGAALLTSGDQSAMADLLPGIASGSCVATLAITEADGRPELGAVSTVASRVADGWVIDGEKCFVLDGCAADIILVAALSSPVAGEGPVSGLRRGGGPGGGGPSGGVASGGGLSLFAVRGGASGLERTALTTMDQTRRQARLVFSATPAQLVGLPGEAGPGLERTLQLAAVALAAEQVGGAQRCLEMAVDYAQARVQFGRPIGSFQAVKHRLAEMLVEVEQARSAAYMAGWVAAAVGERGWASADAEPSGSGGSGGSGGSNGLSEGGGAVAEPGRWNGLREGRGLALLASVAKAYCSDAYFHAAEGCIQVHGGIGFTWEHDAHLYFKRAKSSQLALGDPTYHRELVASSIGL